jgi:hypothetical protein
VVADTCVSSKGHSPNFLVPPVNNFQAYLTYDQFSEVFSRHATLKQLPIVIGVILDMSLHFHSPNLPQKFFVRHFTFFQMCSPYFFSPRPMIAYQGSFYNADLMYFRRPQ